MLLSGLSGGVLVNGIAYPFARWSAPLNCKLITRNNWPVAPYQRMVAGFFSADLTISGPYDAGNTPIVSGGSYLFILQWTPALALVITAFVDSLRPDNNAEEAPNIEVTAKSSGPFVAAIL